MVPPVPGGPSRRSPVNDVPFLALNLVFFGLVAGLVRGLARL